MWESLSLTGVWRHMVMHSDNGFYKCTVCGENFIFPSLFKMHQKKNPINVNIVVKTSIIPETSQTWKNS